MALITFQPSIAPSPGTSFEKEVRILRSEFGDGYTQDAPDGLNHIKNVVTLNWTVLPLSVKLELDDFFTERGGYKPFMYQPHGISTSIKWKCKEWGASGTAPFTFTAKLVQDFSLGS